MKLRLTADSLRLRIGRSDLNTLVESARLELSVALRPVVLRVVLVANLAAPAATAEHCDGCVTVTVPAEQLRRWAQSDEEALAFAVTTGADAPVRVSIEKDFPCDRRADCDAGDDTFAPDALRLQR